MKKNFSLDLSMLALSALMALIVPSSAVMGGSCVVSTSKLVTSSITADTLSAVSGTQLPLHISIKNEGGESFKDGSVIIVIAREPKANDFSKNNQFIVTRSVVKTGVNLEANSSAKLSFVWNIPASLPSGVYRADSIFSQGGQVFKNANSSTNNPFGTSAKIFVSGEATGTLFFIASVVGEANPRIVLVNTIGKDVNVPVTFKTYSGSLSGNLIKSESKVVFSKAGLSTEVPYSTDGLTKPFSISAETIYKGVTAFYAFASDIPEVPARGCSDENPLYSWAMLIGGLGVMMLVLAHAREKRMRRIQNN